VATGTWPPRPDLAYRFVARAPAGCQSRPVVVGAGPCGLLAALVLAQMGFRPILLERGKAVRERTRDTWGLWRKGELNPESNVQFGEGGAGTFSDGKLYSQIKDPLHHGRKVLEEFVKAGAPPEILYVSKPHIGTFKLVSMVEHMRASIEGLGGEIRFQSRVVDVEIEAGRIRAVLLADGERIPPTTWSWPWATAPGTPSACCSSGACTSSPSPSPWASASNIPSPSSTTAASASRPATRPWGPPTTSWCTTPATAAPPTASACARAARWWPPPRNRGAW
jgi:hypothetical protein